MTDSKENAPELFTDKFKGLLYYESKDYAYSIFTGNCFDIFYILFQHRDVYGFSGFYLYSVSDF